MVIKQMSEQLTLPGNLLVLLNDEPYNRKITTLGNASIGAHTRHIIEILKCAADGYDTETIDYLNRERNLLMEIDRHFAMRELRLVANRFTRADKQMNLATDSVATGIPNYVTTTYFREIVYNTEHAFHHLALIRVALRVMKLSITGDDFGMACSTIKYIESQNKGQR